MNIMIKTTLMFILILGLLQTKAQDFLISFAGIGATMPSSGLPRYISLQPRGAGSWNSMTLRFIGLTEASSSSDIVFAAF
jgi:hypothetical protein